MKLQQFFWIIPFFSFIIGYSSIHIFFNQKKTIDVPNLIGTSIIEASKIFSDHNLNLRIISQKEESDFIPGTILSQNPINQKVKQNQTVYVVISKKPEYFKMPDFRNKKIDEIQKILSKENLKPKIYYLESLLPENVCIAQYPKKDESIEDKKIIIYLSSGLKKEIIFPNFKNQSLSKIINILNLNNIKFKINMKNSYQEYKADKHYIIVDQRPFAGSLLKLNPNLTIQLIIAEQY